MTFRSETKKIYASPAAKVLLAAVVSVIPSFATAVSEPAGDFLPSFAGPQNGDLDVLSANVTLDGSNFDFTATVNGPIGETAGAVYVFGVNRGDGTAKFANIGEGGVLFDSTFVIRPSGVSTVNDLLAGTSSTISDITISGSTVSGVVPVSDLPSEGFSLQTYQYSVWPEAGAANAGNTEISTFAPNDSDAQVTSTPEPATAGLLGIAAIALYGRLRRGKSV